MNEAAPKWHRWAAMLLIAVPLFSFVFNLLARMTYAIDMPFYDDFRPFERHTAGSFDLKHLFTPSNDTLYPVGMALDALAQRVINGNSVVYQFLSMLVLLGGLLWMQWRLLSSAIADRLVVAACFALCVFMCQPGTFWGLQNVAYHQGLPTLFILAAIAAVLRRDWSAVWGVPAMFALGLLAGFSYISGAVCALAAASTLIALGWNARPRDRALLQGGIALLAAALIAVAAQAWVIVVVQAGQIHDPRAPWTLPIELNFWLFLLGKVGRALAFYPDQPALSLAVVVAVVSVVIGLFVALTRHLRAPGRSDEEKQTAIVFVTLFVTIAAYLATLSGARTGLRPPGHDGALQVFSFAFANYFHFFWVTLLLPWVLAALYVVAKKYAGLRLLRSSGVIALLAMAVVLHAVNARALKHHAFYQDLQAMRMELEVRCLQEALYNGREIRCERFGPVDFTPTLNYARLVDSSFTRYFPLLPLSFGTDDPPPLFRLTANPASLQVIAGPQPQTTSDGLVFPAEPVVLIVDLPKASLEGCARVDVAALIQAKNNDSADMMFMRRGRPDFSAPISSANVIGKDEPQTLTFVGQNSKGYEPRLRLAPNVFGQAFVLKDLEVRCRIPTLEAAAAAPAN